MAAAWQVVASVVLGASEHVRLQPQPPRVDAASGEWLVSAWDVECIAAGAGILGCGGGGSPYLGKLRVLQQLEAGKTIRVLNPLRCMFLECHQSSSVQLQMRHNSFAPA